MRKFRLYFDKDKEIIWLNDMSRQGWNVTRFTAGVYTFEPCSPGEYVYEADLKDRELRLSDEYQAILEEQSIEPIPTFGYWFLVRRKASMGPLELYTDTESRLGQYRRIRKMFRSTLLVLLICFWLELLVGLNLETWWPFAAAFVIALALETIEQALTDTENMLARLEDRKASVSALPYVFVGCVFCWPTVVSSSRLGILPFSILLGIGLLFTFYGLIHLLKPAGHEN